MGPEVAAAASIGSMALDAGSSVVKGYGEKGAQDYQAAQAERAAALGRIKADQTDAFMREELATTLGNIDVIRSAANTSTTSPTAISVKAREEEVSSRQRRTAVGNIIAQAEEKEAEADYRRKAGDLALFGSYLGAGAKIGKGLSGRA